MQYTFRKIPLWCLVGLITLCSSIAQTVGKASATGSNKETGTPAKNARIVDFNVIDGGPLHISFSDGTGVEVPLEKGRFGDLRQEAFEHVQIAEDGRHLGWLADYMICAQSYPCHAELVIYQPGQKLIYIQPQYGIIWNWQFLEGGKQVMVRSGFPHGNNTGISKIYDTDTGHGQFNFECPAKRLCPDLAKYYQTCFRTHASEPCDTFVKIFRQLVPKYDCQRSFDHTPTKDYTVPAVWVCKEILASRGEQPVFVESIELLQELRSNDARSFFASADFRSVLDGELAETYIGPSVRAERDMLFQNTLFKPTPLGALPKIGTVFQAPKSASALSFDGGRVHVYHFDVDGAKYFVDVQTDSDVVMNISTRDSKFSTPEGIRIGDTWSEVKASGGQELFGENEIFYVRLPSGWLCTFSINDGESRHDLAPESRVWQLDLQ